MPYGGDTPLCTTLTTEGLEGTFWFPGPGDVAARPNGIVQKQWDEAKGFCLSCPLYLRCREINWGEEYGVWGGTDQYERYRYRRRLAQWRSALTPEQRKQLRVDLYQRMCGPRGLTPRKLALRTGWGERYLKEIYEAGQAADAKAAKERRQAAKAAFDEIEKTVRPEPPFPGTIPRAGAGNLWLRHAGDVLPGHYLAQTEDGAWIKAKFRTRKGSPAIKWVGPGQYRLMVTITAPVIAELKHAKEMSYADTA